MAVRNAEAHIPHLHHSQHEECEDSGPAQGRQSVFLLRAQGPPRACGPQKQCARACRKGQYQSFKHAAPFIALPSTSPRHCPPSPSTHVLGCALVQSQWPGSTMHTFQS
eukprot:1150333-Pelagomonas_calceolata.AAC.2